MDVDLIWREDAADTVDEGESILLGPEINVEGMEFIMINVLVSRVVGRQVPFLVAVHIANHQADHTVMSISITDKDSVQDC